MYTVLVCDDEDLERHAIKRIIEKTCPEVSSVLEAANGIEALEIYKNNKPDIFFCDIKMPGKSGIEVVREIRETDKEQLIVFLTAYDYFNYAKEAVSLGVNEYLLKPTEKATIESLLTRLIAELQQRNASLEESKNIEKKLNLLTGFFQNEFLASVLDRGNDIAYINEFRDIFPTESKYCVSCVFNLNCDNFPDKDAEENHLDLFKQRIVQVLKAELEKYRYTFFIHEKENVFYLMLYPDVETFADDFAVIEEHFKNINQIIIKKTSFKTTFVLKIVNNNPAEIQEALFETKSKLSSCDTGIFFLSDSQDFKKVLDSSVDVDTSKNKLSARLIKLMQEIGKKIDEEYMSVLTLEEAAASVNLSIFYFSKVFKQYWGRNFVDYLNEVRFKNACRLLENPMMNIKEVAVSSGYSDANYFSRVFKTMCGMTPSEYRNKNIK